MPITIEEARTLDLFSRHGNIAKTAAAMRKANSAVVHSMQSIEAKTGLRIFDRTGYRTKLLPVGERLLESCRTLLAAEDRLKSLCSELSSGWEAELRVVSEGIVPLNGVIEGLKVVANPGVPTRVRFSVEFLGAVEETFLATGADLMISVLPPEKVALHSVRLAPVHAFLVAQREHPIVKTSRRNDSSGLRSHTLLTVRGSDPRLNLPTASLECESTLQLNDFYSKKAAILAGLGFGWLPDYLAEAELKSGKLKVVSWSRSSAHIFKPFLYHRGPMRLGRAGRLFIRELLKYRR